MSPKISIVVTLYNEEDNVTPLTRNLVSVFREKLGAEPFELVLVLNGSLDRTPQRAAQVAAEYPEVVLVHVEKNEGYGGGILAGLAAAKGDFIGYTDADEQISAADAATVFITALGGEYDLVKAVRQSRHDGLQRKIISTIFNSMFRLMFGSAGRDINAKPKVFKQEVVRKLQLTSKDWFIDAEVMIKANRLGLSVQEVPIVFRTRKFGSSNVRFSTILEFVGNMWKYRRER